MALGDRYTSPYDPETRQQTALGEILERKRREAEKRRKQNIAKGGAIGKGVGTGVGAILGGVAGMGDPSAIKEGAQSGGQIGGMVGKAGGGADKELRDESQRLMQHGLGKIAETSVTGGPYSGDSTSQMILSDKNLKQQAEKEGFDTGTMKAFGGVDYVDGVGPANIGEVATEPVSTAGDTILGRTDAEAAVERARRLPTMTEGQRQDVARRAIRPEGYTPRGLSPDPSIEPYSGTPDPWRGQGAIGAARQPGDQSFDLSRLLAVLAG